VISCVTADYLAIQFNLFYWHGLVSHTQYANWTAYGCAQSSSNPGCGYIFNVSMDQIGLIVQQVYLGEQPSLDPDDLYQDFCTGNGTLDFTTNVGYPAACSPIGMLTTAYLNRRDVQAALHVMPTQWTECGMVNYSMSGSSMIPLYQGFFKQNPLLNVLIYSGDVDIFTVPFGYTSACLAELRSMVNPEAEWQPWFVNGATAGYFEQFDRYTFATVKGAGHEVPQYQTLSAFNMFQRFITSQSLLDEKHSPSSRRVQGSYDGLKQGMMLKKYGIVG